MADLGKAYVQIIPSAEGIETNIANAIGAGVDKAEKSGGGIGSALANGAKAGLKATGVALGATASAIAAIGTQAVQAYSEYEQLSGGVETLFGNTYSSVEEYADGIGVSLEYAEEVWDMYQDRQDRVMRNAANAYKTAGLSANEYMETVTGFAASLNNSLGENTWQSANYADIAITNMADNANKMGTSMEAIQNAYSGFSKQNYTMLDNLKLGYGGTKAEMERLLHDAEEFEGYEFGTLSIDKFSDIIEAIDIIQDKLGINGTTAKEAASTIQGSLTMTKKAWDNLVTGMADKDSDLGVLIGDLVESAGLAIGNLVPVISTSLAQIGQALAQIVPAIIDALPALITETLPSLLESAEQIIVMLLQGLNENAELIVQMALTIIDNLVNFMLENLPLLIETALAILVALATGITSYLPELIPTIVDVMLTIIDTLVNNIELLIDVALELIIALSEGLLAALPQLVERVPQIIMTIVNTLTSNFGKVFQVAVQIISNIVKGLLSALPQIASSIPQVINTIVSGLKSGLSQIWEVGSQLMSGLWNGISDKIGWVKDQIYGMGGSIISAIKGVFGIHSPSREFAWIGQMLDEGLAEGISGNVGLVDDAMDDVYSSVNSPIGEMTASAAFNSGVASDVAETRSAGGDNAIDILADIRAGIEALRAMDIVLDTGAMVGGLARPLDKQLGIIAAQKARA